MGKISNGAGRQDRSRVNFMEKSWDVIRRYGTQSIMKVGLNQPIMREVLEKIVNSMESDVLTE